MTGLATWAIRTRLLRQRPVALSAAALLLALFVALLSLPFTSVWFNVQDLEAVRARPTFQSPTPYTQYQDQLRTGVIAARFPSIARSAYRFAAWLGYDELGRSMLFRLMVGWLVSLGIGVGAAMCSLTVGVAWGAIAALCGGRIDALMMRTVDILYGLPYVLFVVLLKVVFEDPLTQRFAGQAQLANVVILAVAIGAVSWLTMARVIRGQVLSLRKQPFVEAARACGAGPLRIVWRHLMPNLVGPAVVCATLVVPQAIMQESFLSFLGIGVQPPMPSLGLLAAEGVSAVNPFVGFWWLIVFPCGALASTLIAMNVIGDGVRDALDPKSTALVTG